MFAKTPQNFILQKPTVSNHSFLLCAGMPLGQHEPTQSPLVARWNALANLNRFVNCQGTFTRIQSWLGQNYCWDIFGIHFGKTNKMFARSHMGRKVRFGHKVASTTRIESLSTMLWQPLYIYVYMYILKRWFQIRIYWEYNFPLQKGNLW